MTTVPIPSEIESRWDLVPHRLSLLGVTFEAHPEGTGGTVTGQAAGGAFGALDTPWVRYGLSVWRSRRLASEEASVEIEIPPGAEDDGEPFAASTELTLPAGTLAGAGAVAALIRGFRLSTDQYDEPPPFESDPDLPYAASEGYTSQGLGLWLGPPELDGDEVRLVVRARNSLGPADRADMNAAIPRATTWVRVDLLLVGAFGEAVATRGETEYDISDPDFGLHEDGHEHAPEEEQRVAIEGVPGPAEALFGLSGLDFWLNVEGRHDPACVVVQDEVNYWGEEVSGPGRYVQVISARLHRWSYVSGSGAGEVLADLMFSNSSTLAATGMDTEVGNLCLRARAEVTMLQFDDPEAELSRPDPVDLRLPIGEPASREVAF